MNAQVAFLPGTFVLIHIPLDVYPQLLQPILRTLIPQTVSLNLTKDLQGCDLSCHAPHHEEHSFLNISVTPVECTVVCHISWARSVFMPAIEALKANPHFGAAAAARVSTFQDTYMILSVMGAGLHPAGRVMELSTPLAVAGIPIFFITTYYSDFILFPTSEKDKVINALHDKGFLLPRGNSAAFVSPFAASSCGFSHNQRHPPYEPRRGPDDNDHDDDHDDYPYDELQTRTFELLQKHRVRPRVEKRLELVHCAGREMRPIHEAYDAHRASVTRQGAFGFPPRRTWIDKVDTKLYTCIVSALLTQPRFMSLTLAEDDPPSLLLDKLMLPLFGDTLVGDMNALHVPIMLDLNDLPYESTGIVCGVAGRLIKEDKQSERSELSYHSTARAGAVIVPKSQAEWALSILEPLLNKGP